MFMSRWNRAFKSSKVHVLWIKMLDLWERSRILDRGLVNWLYWTQVKVWSWLMWFRPSLEPPSTWAVPSWTPPWMQIEVLSPHLSSPCSGVYLILVRLLFWDKRLAMFTATHHNTLGFIRAWHYFSVIIANSLYSLYFSCCISNFLIWKQLTQLHFGQNRLVSLAENNCLNMAIHQIH